MVALLELQRQFARALLSPSATPLPRGLAESLAGDWLSGEARLAIHRNNLLVSMTESLAATFPVVQRLVGGAFFTQVTRAFLRNHPPSRPQLSAYGAAFGDFLAGLPDVRDLPYLPDVARLEWAVAEASHAPLLPPLNPESLTAVLPEATRSLRLLLQPSLRYLDSRWPIARIWEVNRADRPAEETVSLSEGPSRLEIRRQDDRVVYRRMEAAAFTFRSHLLRGRPLLPAVEAALAEEPLFDLAAELSSLLRDGLVVGCSLEEIQARSVES